MVAGVGWTYNIFLFGTSAYLYKGVYIVHCGFEGSSGLFGDTYISRACVARLCGENMESIIEFGQLYSAKYTSQQVERSKDRTSLGIARRVFSISKAGLNNLKLAYLFSPPSEPESEKCVTDGTVPP
jgi:hypothetical protein